MKEVPPNARAGLHRADILLRQGRFQEAERHLLESLAFHPTDQELLHTLAIAQLYQEHRAAAALETVEQALARQPSNATYHATKARILTDLEKHTQALEVAEEAIHLDPTNPYAFNARTGALMAMERWKDAEASAREALALDPNDALAANQLSTALRLQGRTAENVAQISGMLARDPLDPFTHASAGWNALQMGDRAAAEQHFLEALRLDPELEYARRGMLEAFRARSPVYRGYLNYAFRMMQLPRQARVGLILGAYVLFRYLSRLAREQGNPVLYALVFLYILFALWTHYAVPAGNLIVLLDRWARHALRPMEKAESLLVGGGVVLAVPLLIFGLVFDAMLLVVLGVMLLAVTMPLRYTLTNGRRAGQWVFGAATLYMAGVGLLYLCKGFLSPAMASAVPGLVGLGVILFIVVQLLPGLSALYRPR